MIRNRLKGLVRKIAVKALNMEFDTQTRPENNFAKDVEFDESKIPKVVDGSGDTPGPNHKTDIGRTWVSAQLSGGVAPFFIDIRPPSETVSGILPNAIIQTGDSIKNSLHILPKDKTERITIYDQTGDLGSDEIAQWLREQGWTMARKLRGGFAEWLEHDELLAQNQTISGAKYQIGDPIQVNTDHGYIHKVLTRQDIIEYEVWVKDKGIVGTFPENDLVQMQTH